MLRQQTLTLMRNLLPKKNKYYVEFADAIAKQYRQIKYGIDTCRTGKDLDLVTMRKELVDWQSNDDNNALSDVSINYTTWLPVTYQSNDPQVTYNPNATSAGPGYYTSTTGNSPTGATLGVGYGTTGQNIIEVNAGGCITRINLNPAITINNQAVAQFAYHQLSASDTWTINHSLGFVPNVTTTDEQGNEISGVVTSSTTTTTVIEFSEPVNGYAYLS